MTQARDTGGYPSPPMHDIISLVELALYIAAILALSSAVTWVVVKISPSESTKEIEASEKGKS